VTSVTETICCQEVFDAVEPGRRSAAKLAGAADRGEYCQAAGAVALGLIALPLDERMTAAALSGVPPMEKHELGKIDFELIDDAFNALLQSRPDPMTADNIVDLRNKFRDAFTGWLEIDEAA